ncbi:MAG: ribosome maturation factor RimP [Rickettsiales bacterium]|nr:ribosome maturation factor RimP [Rickettsiales bacterium]MCA0254612.1 ribosome maturation factor RimP [Pseudomonadota bacterium]
MEEKIAQLIEDTIHGLGYELVKITVHGTREKVVEVMIERQDEQKIQLSDCQLVSRNISAIMDVEDIVDGKYFLEVSSAGVERPLVKPNDYIKFSGRDAKVRLKSQVQDRLNVRGKILGVNDNKVMLKVGDEQIEIEFENIKSGKLVLTDELFKQLLKKKN